MNSETCSSEDSRHSGIQVIARSAAIMRVLGGNPGGLSLAAIAREVELPRSTVQRIVCALEAEYLVEPIGPGGGFRLGPAVGKLLYQTQTDIISVVRPYLDQLTVELDETAFLALQAGDGIRVIDRVIATRALRVVFPIGSPLPLHSTSAGKAILMPQSDAAVEALLSEELARNTDRTITIRNQFLQELATARQRGFATDCDEQTRGISSYAVPLETYLGVFALGIVLPSARLADCTDVRVGALQKVKREVERRIGAEASRS